MNPEKYTYQISWSEEDGEYVATVLEFPSLSWLDPERAQAEQGLLNLVAEVLEDMAESGEKIPTPWVSVPILENSTFARRIPCTAVW